MSSPRPPRRLSRLPLLGSLSSPVCKMGCGPSNNPGEKGLTWCGGPEPCLLGLPGIQALLEAPSARHQT